MAAITTKFFILSLTAAVAFAVIDEEGPDSPRHYNNHPVSFKPMERINEIFDSESSTHIDSLESTPDFTTVEPEKNLNEKEEISSSEFVDGGDELTREKKALTTICIKVKSENPYENREYCEPLTKDEPYIYGANPPGNINYGYPPQHPQVRPSYPNGPYKHPAARPIPKGFGQPATPANPGSESAKGSKNRPVYPAKEGTNPAYQSNNEKPYTIIYDIVPPKIQVVPHVPVAEPYHVPPQSPGRPYKMHGGGYRASPSEQDPSAVDGSSYPSENGARTSYNPYDKHEGKPIYDYHKTKSIEYLPVMTKTIKKTSPLEFLKVLKDIKKKKIKYEYEDDDDYEPAYGHPSHGGYGDEYEPPYGGHKSGYNYDHYYHPHAPEGYGTHQHHEEDNTHGLVITCQPSAIGYNGPQPQLELSKHMDLLKHLIHVESDRMYGQAPQVSYPHPQLSQKVQVSNGYEPVYQMSHAPQYGSQPSSAVHMGEETPSEGYVPPAAYRNPEGEQWSYTSQTGGDTHQPPYGRNAGEVGTNWEGNKWEGNKWEGNKWEGANAMTDAQDVGSTRQVQNSANPVAPTNVNPTVSMPNIQQKKTLEQYSHARKSAQING